MHSGPSAPSIALGSTTSRPQAEVDGLTKEADVSETDYGLFRADGMYSRTILHYCVLIISSHHTQ